MRNLLLLDIILDIVINLVIVYIYIYKHFFCSYFECCICSTGLGVTTCRCLTSSPTAAALPEGLGAMSAEGTGPASQSGLLAAIQWWECMEKTPPQKSHTCFFSMFDSMIDDRLREIFWPFLCFFRAFWRNSMTCKLLHDLFHFGSRIFE